MYWKRNPISLKHENFWYAFVYSKKNLTSQLFFFFFFNMVDIIFPHGKGLKKCFKEEQNLLYLSKFYAEE